jgi:hypothetical protein
MAPATHFIDSVVLQTIRRNGDHGPQERQAAPETIVRRHVAAMQLPCPSSPEALTRVMRVPDVQITDLRPFGRQDTAHTASRNGPGAPGTDREYEAVYEATRARG